MLIADLSPGLELGPSAWLEIDQERIDAFAHATLDTQWIHTDPERAAAGPYGATIAHGYLTLSLLAGWGDEIFRVDDAATKVNYGLNKVRFLAPVVVGTRVRARAVVAAVEPKSGGTLVTLDWTVENEDADRPALIAQTLVLITG